MSDQQKLYTISWAKPVTKEIYGIKCKFPTPPPDREFVNYGLPVEKQKFRRVKVPDNLFDWQFMGETKKKEMDAFIAAEHHKRKHGYWMFIKGQKFYITGVMHYFINYWYTENGYLPTFKIADLYFFQVWFHVCYDPKCYGLVDFKPRRIGDTEKALCIVYEYGTRVRNVRCGMQSNTGDDIREKFTDRLIYAHDKMVWFMKPINRGSTNPQEGLILDYPVTFNSSKAIEERVKKGEAATTSSDAKYAYPPIKSKIDYKASTPKQYNGKRLGRYYLDEFGMMEEMDPNEAWALVKMAQKDPATEMIVGKALMTANVDEVGKDKSGTSFSRVSMDYAHQLYEDSDPNTLDENGETTNGLVHILRTWRDNCPVDAWGFPMIEAAAIRRKNTIENLIRKRKVTLLYQYRRQNPENWDDVFLSSGEGSGMDVERLLARLQYLKEPYDLNGKKKPQLWFRGNLEWVDDVFGGDVKMIPHTEGLWWFSHNGLPHHHGVQANAKSHNSLKRPGNIDTFCMGVDPYEEKDAIEKHPSLGGIAVRRVKDILVDGEKVCKTAGTPEEGGDQQDNLELGDPLNYGFDWLTNKYMCGYLHRHPDPNKFYEDGLKTAIFYGCDALIEKNKGRGMISKWEQWEYGGYVQDRPEFTKTDYSKDQKEQAITAVEGTIELYFKALKTESVKMANSIDIPIIAEQISTLNWKNRTKKDLAVACGWAHVAGERNVKRKNRNKSAEAKKPRVYWQEQVL